MTTISTASTSSTPISNSFLNAKAQSFKRPIPSSYDMNSTSSNSSYHHRRGSSTLAVVPENHGHNTSIDYPIRGPPPAPPSAFKSKEISDNGGNSKQRKSTRRTISDTSASSGDLRELEKQLEMKMRRSSPEKGKSKDLPSSNNGRQQQSKRKRADWVIDLVETQKGVETWLEDQRVMLVLGDATPVSLAPILYDPAFSDTLLLVGSNQPLPDIEALLSPSHLMSSSPNQQIFPTVQPFTPSIDSNDTDAHALTVLIAQATTLAQQFRSKPRGSTVFTRPRAESYASSSASNSPPSTPPIRKRVLSNFGISATSSARSSMESNISIADRQRSASMYDTSNSNDSTPKAKNRLTSFGRDSIFGGIRRNSDASDISSKAGNSSSTLNSSLFDAIVNFVPEMKNFKPERSLQDMLHQAVVITTGIIPSITKQQFIGKSSSSSLNTSNSNDQMPISLIHVLPKLMPSPLPNVIESFLLSLLPTFQLRSTREIFGCIVTNQVWLSPFVESRSNSSTSEEDVSGAQVLLFGGTRCPYQVLDKSQEEFKPRAFLSNWSNCINMPGLISESRSPSGSSSIRSRPSLTNVQHGRQKSLPPPSIPYNSVQSRTPPQSRSPSPPPKNLPRSVSMPMTSSSTTSSINSSITTNNPPIRRSKLNVSHTPPMMSEIDLPSTSTSNSPIEEKVDDIVSSKNLPSTPDLDSSIDSSCSSSIALGEMNSNGSTGTGNDSRRESEIGNESIVKIGENSNNRTSTISNTSEKLGSIGKKSFKNWFKKNKNDN